MRWSLEAIADAMRRPVFVPYLGRKACPLGLPLGPGVVESTDAVAALRARHADGPEARFRRAGGEGEAVVAIDADAVPDEAAARRIELRRDQPRSRRRWQFDLRREAILGVPPS